MKKLIQRLSVLEKIFIEPLPEYEPYPDDCSDEEAIEIFFRNRDVSYKRYLINMKKPSTSTMTPEEALAQFKTMIGRK